MFLLYPNKFFLEAKMESDWVLWYGIIVIILEIVRYIRKGEWK